MRSPRRTFAAPFVITVASACTTAPPASHGPTEPAPPPPTHTADPGPTIGPVENPPAPSPPQEIHGNPPPPTEFSWALTMAGGKCSVHGHVSCPTQEPGKPMRTCNPPAPRPYECLPGMTDGAQLTIVQRGTSCVIPPPPVSCPPKAMCNPPPPREVPCPSDH